MRKHGAIVKRKNATLAFGLLTTDTANVPKTLCRLENKRKLGINERLLCFEQITFPTTAAIFWIVIFFNELFYFGTYAQEIFCVFEYGQQAAFEIKLLYFFQWLFK